MNTKFLQKPHPAQCFFTTKSYLHQSSRTMSELLEKDSALQEKRVVALQNMKFLFVVVFFLHQCIPCSFSFCWLVSGHWFRFLLVKVIYFSFSLGSLEILSSFSTSKKSAAILETGKHDLSLLVTHFF